MKKDSQEHKLLRKYTEILEIFYAGVFHSAKKELFGWESETSQTERFRIILEEASTHFSCSKDDSFADIGCGHAAFYVYMRERGHEFKYTGFDFYAKFVDECKRRFPGLDFYELDILSPDEPSLGTFDIVCMSGLLNLNIQKFVPEIEDANFKVLDIVLQRLLKSARKGVVTNFLDERSKYMDSFFAYHNHKDLIKKLEKHGYIVLGMRDDYLHNDFTLTLASPNGDFAQKKNLETSELKIGLGSKNTEQENKQEVSIYTDGGCKGNPGVGAWAFYVPDEKLGKSGSEKETTNNKMELNAAIEALRWACKTDRTKIHLYTDSQYVQKGITDWIFTWKKNKWKTAAKKPVKNQDLWQALDELRKQIEIEWHWVKGHAGQEGNERAHELVTKSIEECM